MSARSVAKPSRRNRLTKAELTELGREYRLVMQGPPSLGGGWPALWEGEDVFIQCQDLPDPEHIEWRDLPAAEVSDALAPIVKALEWRHYSPSALTKPPWTWTPHEGALEDSFARAVRWAYHHGYPQPMEMVSEDWVARLLERSRTSRAQADEVGRIMSEEGPEAEAPHAWLKRMLLQALEAGREIEREALRERLKKLRACAQGRDGRPRKGIPRDASPEQERRRDIRRAVLVAFLSTRGLLISHQDDGGGFRSACDAVALAETVSEKVAEKSPPRQPNPTLTFCGEAAISLLVHTRIDYACREIAEAAWRAAEKITREKQENGEPAAQALWDNEREELGGQVFTPEKPGTGYETVRKTWQRFSPSIDDIAAQLVPTK